MQTLFKLCYRPYIEAGKVLTTLRTGDKTKSYPKDRILSFIVGSKFKPEVIGYGKVTSSKPLKFSELTTEDLVNATPDAQTPEGMRISMWLTSRTVVKDDDVVTLVNWEYVTKEQVEEMKNAETIESQKKREEKKASALKKQEVREAKKKEREAKKIAKESVKAEKAKEREAKKIAKEAEKRKKQEEREAKKKAVKDAETKKTEKPKKEPKSKKKTVTPETVVAEVGAEMTIDEPVLEDVEEMTLDSDNVEEKTIDELFPEDDTEDWE